MKSEKLKFINSKGIELSARIDLPINTKPIAFALFAHCFTCSKNLTAVTNISKSLTANGIAVLRFDFTGLGESEGDFADTNFSSNVEDLISAAEYLGQNYNSPSVLIGHSLGGAAVILAAQSLKSVKAVATIGAPYEPVHVKHLINSGKKEIIEKGEAEITIGGRPFKIKKQFLDDIGSANMEDKIRHLHRALLIMHSPQDSIVEIENAEKIYKTAVHPKSFVSLDGADHLLSKKDNSLYAGEIISSWVKRYIDLPEEPELSSSNQVVVRTGVEGFTTLIKSGNHRLIADEPESVGGNNFGPTPYDLLLASLGSCTSMTLRMYANHKKFDVKNITVHLNHSKTHCDDCENIENTNAKIDNIERLIEIDGNLTKEQLQRMIEIADKCPVHKTLHGEIKVETKLKEN